MLIGLNIDVEDKDELDKQIKKFLPYIPGTVRIVKPRSIEEHSELISKYRPRDLKTHLIVLGGHYLFSLGMSKASWRMHEYFFDLAGGTMWGDPPPFEDSLTYQGPFTDYATIAASGTWGAGRSTYVRGLSRKYLGRASVNPHTILVGYTVHYPHSSNVFDYLLESLPDTWWQGVGFVRAGATTPDKFFDYFTNVNYVTIGEPHNSILAEKGIEHASFPKIEASWWKRKVDPKLGVALRDLADNYRVIETWKPTP